MATCDGSAAGWRAAGRRWLVPLNLGLVAAGLVGVTCIADGWLALVAWFAGGVLALIATAEIDQWRYGRFLAATDRDWIEGLRHPPAGVTIDQQQEELLDRFMTPWNRHHRWTNLADAIAAATAWCPAQDVDRRFIIDLMCAAVQEAAPRMPATEVAGCLARLRSLLLASDRGLIDGWGAPRSEQA